ncbi:hypothetical protein [Geopseudomonas aromaticivorans]
MSDSTKKASLLQELAVTETTAFLHGNDSGVGKNLLTGLLVAVTLATSIGNAFAGQSPEHVAERAAATAQAEAKVQNALKGYELNATNPNGVSVTISSEYKAPALDAAFTKKAEAEINRGIDLFNKTHSWDQVMAKVVAPSLQSKDADARMAGYAALNFYMRSSEATANRDQTGVQPISQDAWSYLTAHKEQVAGDYQAAKAIDTLTQASLKLDAGVQVTPETLAAQLDKMGGPSYDDLVKDLPNAGDPVMQIERYAEYTLGIINQAKQYEAGDYIDHPEVAAAEKAISEKLDTLLVVQTYGGSHQQHQIDQDRLDAGNVDFKGKPIDEFHVGGYGHELRADFKPTPIEKMDLRTISNPYPDDCVGCYTPRG